MYRPHGRYWYTYGISKQTFFLFCSFLDFPCAHTLLFSTWRLASLDCNAFDRAPYVAWSGPGHHTIGFSWWNRSSLRSSSIYTFIDPFDNVTSVQDISFLFGCFGGAAVYLSLSFIFPAKETFLDEAILPPDDDSVDGQTSHQIEKKSLEDEKEGSEIWM